MTRIWQEYDKNMKVVRLELVLKLSQVSRERVTI